MRERGIYIREISLLEQLNDMIEHSGKSMAEIDTNVGNYINAVYDALERQLDFLRGKLEEAQQRLSDAENALSSCEASQVFVPEMGGYVPSCISEEMAVTSAREEVAEWQHKYDEGNHIVEECQREISEYELGGHALIEKMANDQTPRATEQLRDGIAKIEDVLAHDVSGKQISWANNSDNNIE